jgi:hypothetical protein
MNTSQHNLLERLLRLSAAAAPRLLSHNKQVYPDAKNTQSEAIPPLPPDDNLQVFQHLWRGGVRFRGQQVGQRRYSPSAAGRSGRTQRSFRIGTSIALALTGLLSTLNPSAVAADATAKPGVVFIDDVSSSQLKQHGIEAFDPEGLARAFDTLAGNKAGCTILYVPVRQQAFRAIPVIVYIPQNMEEPPAPPERGLKLPDLQKAWLAFRQAKASYDERLQAVEAQREEVRQRFILKSLDALANAEAEVLSLRRGRGNYRASDIEGTILSAIATAKTLRCSSLVVVLNTDLDDAPTHRRARKTPFTEEELPPDLVRALVLVNTSFKPDASALISKTTIAKHHAVSLKGATDLVATLLADIK